MNINKALLLFCGLLAFSISLLLASAIKHKPISGCENIKSYQKCCNKEEADLNATPWNLLIEGMLHIVKA